MSELTRPYQLLPERKLSKQELVVALRQAVIAEHDATAQYTLQAEASGDPLVRAVLLEIADEERAHIGELTLLLEHLTGDEEKLMEDGRREVRELANKLASGVEGLLEEDEDDGEGEE